MPIEIPNLDDQSYAELLAETLRRIPSHTPEWTNHAVEADPGTTLVQLFAFIADNVAYRANRVPEKNRLKFLNLLGLGLKPAAAAEGMVSVRNARGALDPVAFEVGARFEAGEVRFASLDALNVLPLESVAITKQATDESTENVVELYAELDRAINLEAGESYSFYESAILAAPTPTEPEPEIDLVSTLDGALYVALLGRKGSNLADVRAKIGGETLHLGIVPVPEEGTSTLLPAPLSQVDEAEPQLRVELWDGNVSQPAWTPLESTAAVQVLSEPGILEVSLPGASELPTWAFGEASVEGKGDLPPLVQDEELAERIVVWLRLRPIGGSAGTDSLRAKLRWIGVNATRVRQSVHVTDELVGTGTGEPDQQLELIGGPVRVDGLTVTTQVPGAVRSNWTRIEDLIDADPDDAVFELDPEARTLTFGDGQRGLRPGVGERVLASYDYGGGTAGNVGIGEITGTSEPALQGGFEVANPLPTVGGDEPEAVSDGERAIAATVRHRDRLVTSEDFSEIAARTPGVDVARVEVLPLFDPNEGDGVAGVVSLMVIPDSDTHFPSPDGAFLSTVCRYLDPRRLITTQVHVLAPDYRDMSISVGIQVRSGRSRESVKEAVRVALLDYLSAAGTSGPDGADGNGWPMYREVLSLELEAVAARVPGVQLVKEFLLGDADGNVVEGWTLTGVQLPRVVAIGVQEGSADGLAELLGAGEPLLTDDVIGVPVIPENC